MGHGRSLGKKTGLAAPLVLALVFTFIIYAVLDLVMVNRQNFSFGLTDILGPVLVIAAFSAAILYLVLMLLPGRGFDAALSLLLGLLVAGYLQGAFLNLPLGQLTGETIHWERYAAHAAWNLALWMALLLLPLLLRHLAPKVWRGLVVFVPVIVIGMQGAALVAGLAAYDFSPKPSEKAMLTEKGMFELSSQDNILVFLFDRLDTRYVAAALEGNPAFLDNLDGFTYYPNHVASYARTYPAATYMLTGESTLFEDDPETYFTRAWDKEALLTTLREEGYTTKMYPFERYITGNAEKMVGLLDNVETGQRRFDTWGLMNPLMRLSAYRNVPHALKASLWMASGEFDTYESYVFDGAEKFRPEQDHLLYQKLVEQGLTLQDDSYNYAFYHISGAHGPFYLNEWTEYKEEASLFDQMRGEFNLLYTFFDQMKELGVYEESTIIIVADHGNFETGNNENLTEATTCALFIKPWGSAGEMLQVSEAPVSHDNLRATIIDAAMLDAEPFGVPVSAVAEDAQVVRKMLFQVDKGPTGEQHLEEFEIIGDARNFEHWKKVTDHVFYDKDKYM